MEIKPMDSRYVEEAVHLAQFEYDMARNRVESLFEKDFTEVFRGALTEMFKGKYGVVALEEGKLVGYLCFWGGWDGQFGNVIGSYSPLFGHAASGENRGKIMAMMIQYASEVMVQDRICSYVLTGYASDETLFKELCINGFGIRCADSMRRTSQPLEIVINTDYTYEELHYSQAGCLLEIKNELIRHLGKSPTYMPLKDMTLEHLQKECERRKSRFFVAKKQGEIIGFLEATEDGENFITEVPNMKNICGAYVKESHRGQNIAQSLLKMMNDTLRDEGIEYLGVDYETINPTALRFWTKYFECYTYSYVRRIDERILEKARRD